jgi:AcrR family transcriptional regulator
MNARSRLASEALAVLEQDGIEGFSTRKICERAGVTAPTLYHHFGDADGLVSAAVDRGFEEFLARKVSRPSTAHPEADLLEGWDDYVAFARERPRIYAAMIARVFGGGAVPAAEAARAHLVAKLDALAGAEGLALPVQAAADLLWATAHSAAMLYASRSSAIPDDSVIAALRASAASVLINAPERI